MTKVYRLEGSDGLGVYRTSDFRISELGRIYKTHKSGEKRPSPYEEFRDKEDMLTCNGYTPYDVFYGFKNITQLKEWFTPAALKVFKEKGVKLVIYDAEEVLYGKKQVAFIMKNAKKLDTKDLK